GAPALPFLEARVDEVDQREAGDAQVEEPERQGAQLEVLLGEYDHGLVEVEEGAQGAALGALALEVDDRGRRVVVVALSQELHAEADVEVLSVHEEVLVEASHGAEEIGLDAQEGAGHGIDL